jgi:glycosyltransferase involved in cell wall biosynthesis
MPVYNGEKYITESLDSILNQTFTRFEFLIIDDGSTDETFELLKQYAKSDSRIRIYRNNTNQGVAVSLNAGLNLARSSLIARMDVDDVAHPYRLANQLEFLQEHPEVAVCGSAVEIYEHPDRLWIPPTSHEAICAKMLFESCLYHPATIYRKDTILAQGGYNPLLSGAQDYDLWQRLSGSPSVRFANIDEPLLRYRTHFDADRSEYKVRQSALADRVRRNQIVRLGIDPDALFFSCHSALAFPRMAPTIPPLKACRTWLDLITEANCRTRVYSKTHLQKELEARWLVLCIHVAKSHPRTIVEYLSNSSSIGPWERFYQSTRMIWRALR